MVFKRSREGRHRIGRLAAVPSVLLACMVALAACQDPERAFTELDALCRAASRNLQPGSGVHWGEADEFIPWIESNPSQLAQDAYQDYRRALEQLRARSGRTELTAADHADAFRLALEARGIAVPDCADLMAYHAQRSIYEARIWDLYPLCEAYDERVSKRAAADESIEGRERDFIECAREWRLSGTRTPAALGLVDRLLALNTKERGRRIRSEIEAFFGAPGGFNRCTSLVWDAEESAGMPKSSIR